MYKTGQIVEGTITGIQNYGAFVSIGDCVGLVHISEISDGFVRKIDDFLQIGKTYTFYVIDCDEDGKHVKLSYKKIHEDTKNRYVSRSTKILDANTKYFNDTYLEVKNAINNLETSYLTLTYKSVTNRNVKDIDFDNLDFNKYLNELLEKDTLKIKEIHQEDKYDKLVIVSDYEHFDLYDGVIDYLGLAKDKLIYLLNNASLSSIENTIDYVKNYSYKVIFIFKDEYSENDGIIFRLFRKDLEQKDLDPTKHIYFFGQEEDEDLIDLINKENYIFFNETKIDTKFGTCLPSGLFVFESLGVDDFKILQGMRLGLTHHYNTKDYLEILSKANDGKFDIRYSSFYKLLKYYEPYINLDIGFDYSTQTKLQLPKYKDHLKKLNGKEGKFINEVNSNSSLFVKLKINDEFSLTYLLSLLYLLIKAK